MTPRAIVAPTTASALTSLALVGHCQVTDAYLLAWAQHRGGKLAAVDNGVSDLITAVADRPRYVSVIDVR